MFFTLLKSFLYESCLLLIHNPKKMHLFSLTRHFFDWRASFNSNRNALADKLPWISFAAIRFLENNLHKTMKVYEYGSGGSTLFFAKYANNVISIEHDRIWYEKVLEEINRYNLLNCQIKLFEPIPDPSWSNKNISDPDAYISADSNYRGMSFKNYASSIDIYPDEYFEVVFIDGRSRPSCYKHAKSKVRINGYLILDNSERQYYYYIHNDLNNELWKKFEYHGLFPYQLHFSETCIWQRLG